MARTRSDTSHPSTGSSEKEETLSEKLSSSRRGADARRSSRKRLSLTSETTHSTAASSNAMPLKVLATPISPQEPGVDHHPGLRNDEGKRKSHRRVSSVSRDKTKGKHASKDDTQAHGCASHSSSLSNQERKPQHSTSSGGTSRSTRGSTDTPNGRRRRSSSRGKSSKRASQKVPVTSPDNTIQKRTSKSKRSSTTKTKGKLNNSEKSTLTSFMHKEYSSRPNEDREEALEVKSAYTSVSRSRNRTKQLPVTNVDDSAMSASYHGGSTRRKQSFRDMVHERARANSRHRETDSVSSALETNLPSSFLRSLPEDLQQQLQLGSESESSNTMQGSFSEADSTQGFHAHVPGFASLPVLPEESKKLKKTKSKNSSHKTRKKSGSVSQQELSDFLDQCNSKRRQQGGVKESPLSGDRSCVSMPALLTAGKARKPSSTNNKKAPLYNTRQQSQRSLETGASDPMPNATATVKRSRRQLIEQLEEKGRRSRSANRRRGHQQKGSITEGRRRSSSRSKEGKVQKDDRTPRSLSRSRRTSQSDQSLSRRKSPGRINGKRTKGLNKIFSIRDLKTLDKDDTTSDTTTEGLNGESKASPVALRTPSNSQRGRLGVYNEFIMMTPPPPLAPHSPLHSGHNRRIIDEGGKKFKESSQGRRLPSSVAEPLDGARGSQAEDGEVQRIKRRHSSHGQSPVSIPKDPTEQESQVGGDETDETDATLQADYILDYEADLDDEAYLGIEEDVFSHYTWSNGATPTRSDAEEFRQDRKRLKDSIRESLLFNAFEAIESDL